MTPVLWQLAYSHFNEKVRWALSFKGIAHERRSLLPGLHIPRVVWMTRQKQLPVLELEGARIADSSRIIAALELRWPRAPLLPARGPLRARALELEDFFDEQLGAQLRCGWFYSLLQEPQYARRALSIGSPEPSRRRYAAMFPALSAAMKLDMGLSKSRAARAWQATEAALDRMASEIQPSGYLVGHAFSVADLTAAALLSPLLPDDVGPFDVDVPLPDRLAQVRARYANHDAVRWAVDVVRRHRPQRKA